jgi:hypothetical protein
MDGSDKIKRFPDNRIVRTPDQINDHAEAIAAAEKGAELASEIDAMMGIPATAEGAASWIEKHAKTPANAEEVANLMTTYGIKQLAEKVEEIEVTPDGSWSETSSPASIAQAFLKKLANLKAGHQ